MSITFDFLAVLQQWPLLLKGVAWTLGLTLIATVIGVGFGIACAWVRSQSGRAPGWLQWVVGSYVELIRNTPFIVQLFFIFFGLPAAGVKLSPERNESPSRDARRISADDSRIEVLVVPTNEELEIARQSLAAIA